MIYEDRPVTFNVFCWSNERLFSSNLGIVDVSKEKRQRIVWVVKEVLFSRICMHSWGLSSKLEQATLRRSSLVVFQYWNAFSVVFYVVFSHHPSGMTVGMTSGMIVEREEETTRSVAQWLRLKRGGYMLLL
jgi:hypothetical protein